MKTKHTKAEWAINTKCYTFIPLSEEKRHELRINQDVIYSVEVRLGNNIPTDIYGFSVKDATRKATLIVAVHDLLRCLSLCKKVLNNFSSEEALDACRDAQATIKKATD